MRQVWRKLQKKPHHTSRNAFFFVLSFLFPLPYFCGMTVQEQRLGDRIEQLEKEIRSWANVTKSKLLFRLAQLNLQDRVRLGTEISLRKSIRTSIRKKGGEIENVAFSFARQGIFIEHGVGNGRPRNSAKANRYRKPWISEEIPTAIYTLADILETEFADIAAGELKIVIPGIYNTKISI